MMLVVDITKGVQTQTAECLVIGEITCDKMIIVLNKIDLIPADKRAATIDRVSIIWWFIIINSPFQEYIIVNICSGHIH